MGQLARFNLADLITKYGIKHFVETGTGQGHSLAHAARFPFLTLHSCEIEPTLAEAAIRNFFVDDRIHISKDLSPEFIAKTLSTIPFDEPVLFWLDAHFPGADYGIRSYGAEEDQTVRLPLPDELKAIVQSRPAARDLMLIDDLRVWLDGPFASGNLPANVRPFCPADRNIDFCHWMFDRTHEVSTVYADEGYVVLSPLPLADVAADTAAKVDADVAA